MDRFREFENGVLRIGPKNWNKKPEYGEDCKNKIKINYILH
jgi:hypothetical protein